MKYITVTSLNTFKLAGRKEGDETVPSFISWRLKMSKELSLTLTSFFTSCTKVEVLITFCFQCSHSFIMCEGQPRWDFFSLQYITLLVQVMDDSSCSSSCFSNGKTFNLCWKTTEQKKISEMAGGTNPFLLCPSSLHPTTCLLLQVSTQVR